MNIVLVTACLEHGKDGIGDYVRGQAAALTRVGHHIALLALNDSYVITPKTETITAGASPRPALRLPKQLAWKQKTKPARDFLESNAPHWIIFQFAPYSFGYRGLPVGLVLQTENIFKGYSVFLMIHELWLGGIRLTPWHQKYWGLFLQKPIIRLFIRQLSPIHTATSNPLYKRILAQGGVPARLVPIPSNIGNISNEALAQEVRNCLHNQGLVGPQSWHKLGIFGQVHHGGNYIEEIRPIVENCMETKRKLALIFFGRNGRHADNLIKIIRSVFSPSDLTIIRLGERDESFISALISQLNYGIATSPRQLIGKSGTASAFRSHGIKILTPFQWILQDHDKQLKLPGSIFERACYNYCTHAQVAQRILKLISKHTHGH